MARRFRAASGKVAIWEGEGDLLPFNSPLNYLSRVKFHSDLDYVKVIRTVDLTLNLTAIAKGVSQRTQTYTLYAHGLSFTPWVRAHIAVSGQIVDFSGSIPIQTGATDGAVADNKDSVRWIALGMDATHVRVHEYAVLQTLPGSTALWGSFPALSVPVRLYITDEVLP
jgi:hypothetical protein